MKEFSYGVCPYKIKSDGVYILLNKTGRVGDWNFFKGKIEKDESISECALREFREETGISVTSQLGTLFSQSSPRKDVGIYITDWTNHKDKHKKMNIDRKEIFSYRWVRINKNIVTSKNQQTIYNNIFAHLKEKRKQLKTKKV